MVKRSETHHTRITIAIAAERTGLAAERIRHYMRRRLVEGALSEAELAKLRRIRRLSELGVNLAGIEIILRMRQRILELQEELGRLGSTESEGAGQAPIRESPPP
jgi:MerR family transcriptional regulator/heat shock protein HspR